MQRRRPRNSKPRRAAGLPAALPPTDAAAGCAAGCCMSAPPATPLATRLVCRALKGLLGAVPTSSCGLVLTEPYLNLPALREAAVRPCCFASGAAAGRVLGVRTCRRMRAPHALALERWTLPQAPHSNAMQTLPPPPLRQVRMALDELGFASVYMAPPAALALRWHAQWLPGLPANAAGCGLVVDAGFSFTHAVTGPALTGPPAA